MIFFLPVGDTPNPREFRPYVNWGLIAANVLVYVFVTLPLSTQPVSLNDPALRDYLRTLRPDLSLWMIVHGGLSQISAYDLFVFQHGFRPANPQLADLLTTMFLHAGLAHLAGNMLFLWIFGDNVEQRLGRIGYLAAYLGCGVVATITFAILTTRPEVPMVGASGAISGVLGLYYLLFPRNGVKVFFTLFPFIFDVFVLRARLVLVLYVIVDNLLPLVIGGDSSVAYGAHLGGFLCGLGIAWVVERGVLRAPWAKRIVGRARTPVSGGYATEGKGATGPARREDEDALESLTSALAAEDLDSILDMLGRLSPWQVLQLPQRELAHLSMTLYRQGYEADALMLLKKAIGMRRKLARNDAWLFLALGAIRLWQGQEAAAFQHFHTVLDVAPDSDAAVQATGGLRQIDYHRRRRG